MRKASFLLLMLQCLVLAVRLVSGQQQVLHDDGPPNGIVDASMVNFRFVASDSFVLNNSADRYAGNPVDAIGPLPASILSPPGTVTPASSSGYTISHTVPEVRLQFTVADEQGQVVANLSASDIRVLDNESPVERFSEFVRDQNLPLRLGIVLDTSDSVKRVLPEEKFAGVQFLDRIMRPQADRTFVMAFGATIHLWQKSTASRAELIEAMDRMKQPGWGTRFFDALHAACTEFLSERDDTGTFHRAILVVSDGEDTQSFHDLHDVVALAQRSEIPIYALTLHPKRLTPRGDLVLQRLAEETGGRLFVAQSSHNLDGALAAIEQDLRTQYYVSFPAQKIPPGFHSLRVEVNAPQKLQVHARQGYYAPFER